MEPNLTYLYPHTRVQSLVSILRTTVYHAFPVVTENRQNERDFMKGNILISNNIHFKVRRFPSLPDGGSSSTIICLRFLILLFLFWFYSTRIKSVFPAGFRAIVFLDSTSHRFVFFVVSKPFKNAPSQQNTVVLVEVHRPVPCGGAAAAVPVDEVVPIQRAEEHL